MKFLNGGKKEKKRKKKRKEKKQTERNELSLPLCIYPALFLPNKC
uniref:Uncharacterized protein n=1 Tax=Anguilla anguilla TaxID=7936 RepID=A0A0E9W1J4_ANGAN